MKNLSCWVSEPKASKKQNSAQSGNPTGWEVGGGASEAARCPEPAQHLDVPAGLSCACRLTSSVCPLPHLSLKVTLGTVCGWSFSVRLFSCPSVPTGSLLMGLFLPHPLPKLHLSLPICGLSWLHRVSGAHRPLRGPRSPNLV